MYKSLSSFVNVGKIVAISTMKVTVQNKQATQQSPNSTAVVSLCSAATPDSGFVLLLLLLMQQKAALFELPKSAL